jgi:hypothetical protein
MGQTEKGTLMYLVQLSSRAGHTFWLSRERNWTTSKPRAERFLRRADAKAAIIDKKEAGSRVRVLPEISFRLTGAVCVLVVLAHSARAQQTYSYDPISNARQPPPAGYSVLDAYHGPAEADIRWRHQQDALDSYRDQALYDAAGGDDQ